SLVLLYDAWNKYNGHPSMFAPPPRQAASAPAASGSAPGSTVAAGTAAAPATPGAGPAPAGETVVVSTDVVKATLDSRGGTLVRLELLKQKEVQEQPWYEPLAELFGGAKKPPVESDVVLFDRSAQRVYLAETGLVGVPQPITHLTPMQVLPGERALKDGSNDLTVSFASTEGSVKLVKTYVFHRGQYTIDVKHEVSNTGTAPVASPQIYLQLKRDGLAGPGGSSFYSTFTGPALYTDSSKFNKIDFKDIDKSVDKGDTLKFDKTADNGWVAMVQHYFATAWIHNAAQQREFSVTASEPKDNGVGRRLYNVSMLFTLPTLAPGAKEEFDAVLFAGPQEETRLATLAPGLELVKDYGKLKILAEPLFWLLTQLHKFLGNWGWAIVALVVLLKIAFYWLNASAYRSMAKMKAINPKVQELRERYKDKPQQMQQEMMRIYREEKVNPLGGCLPIVVQMPFFISLYWVLLSTVEMRHAPWIGWITDLSAKDPYFILPLLMTLTSLVQVALGAKPPDPVQARMMWIMPLAFSVMFFFFPAGLVLYWLTNNILSIAQQYLINKRMGVLNT
ncbi:MAG TPA: membrane protein insertase YidC, partial [Albitalea sp.]|nr:membrane protein insertase YidC [Albitalea sp.]